MKKYTFRQRIAALIDISDETRTISAIYLAPDKPFAAFEGANLRDDIAKALPATLREVCDARFAQVFALPVEQRGAFIDANPIASIGS